MFGSACRAMAIYLLSSDLRLMCISRSEFGVLPGRPPRRTRLQLQAGFHEDRVVFVLMFPVRRALSTRRFAPQNGNFSFFNTICAVTEHFILEDMFERLTLSN